MSMRAIIKFTTLSLKTFAYSSMLPLPYCISHIRVNLRLHMQANKVRASVPSSVSKSAAATAPIA
jgi:hypothetical protein